jgi:glycosyltransferase involved in cell wall biosynthesis
VESMALGVPVIAMEGSGGPVEILEEGRHGTLVRPGDREGLARAIEDSLAAVHDRAALRRRAQCFDESRIIPEYVEAIEELFKREAPCGCEAGCGDHDPAARTAPGPPVAHRS